MASTIWASIIRRRATPESRADQAEHRRPYPQSSRRSWRTIPAGPPQAMGVHLDHIEESTRRAMEADLGSRPARRRDITDRRWRGPHRRQAALPARMSLDLTCTGFEEISQKWSVHFEHIAIREEGTRMSTANHASHANEGRRSTRRVQRIARPFRRRGCRTIRRKSGSWQDPNSVVRQCREGRDQGRQGPRRERLDDHSRPRTTLLSRCGRWKI